MKDVSYDVRIYKTDPWEGKNGITYWVRWSVEGKRWKKKFRNAAQADTFRSSLVTASRTGEAFSTITGEPVSWQRVEQTMSWYEFACSFVDMKWKRASAGYRRDIARALTAATPALISGQRGKPADEKIRKALTRWAFNSRDREQCPPDVAALLTWIQRNTAQVAALADPTTTRRVLDAAASRLNGKPTAASTARRNRAVLYNAMEYAVEQKLLIRNPIEGLRWKAPKTSHEVDRDSVVNPAQARALLRAVGDQPRSGPRLVAFFGVLYYSGLRPEEAVNLRASNVTLPPQQWNDEATRWEEPPTAWGELRFRTATPEVGSEWTDDGAKHEKRQLKHRAEGDSRVVPCPPELTRLLRTHMAKYPPDTEGRLFSGVRDGNALAGVTYRRAWARARKSALTDAEFRSPLGRRVYDLRHACLSTWLNAGVAPTQVAQWAGHGVDVLLKIYAKCLVGQDDAARRRIADALRPADSEDTEKKRPEPPEQQ